MEHKSLLLLAVSVGVGVGVGIGLASGQSVSNKWGASASSSNAITPKKMEQEMLRLVVDGRESNVTFDQFPYDRSLLPSRLFCIFTFGFIVHTVEYSVCYLLLVNNSTLSRDRLG